MTEENKTEELSENMIKYHNYKVQMKRLDKAINEEFYLEAVFIEYAIMEDRLESILIHSDAFNPKKHNTMERKLRKVEELARNKHGLLKNYISDEIIESIYKWKERRNIFIHALMKQNYSTEELQEIVLSGKDILKILNNKSTLYRRKIERVKQKENKD